VKPRRTRAENLDLILYPNPRALIAETLQPVFQDRCLKPLGHPSCAWSNCVFGVSQTTAKGRLL